MMNTHVITVRPRIAAMRTTAMRTSWRVYICNYHPSISLSLSLVVVTDRDLYPLPLVALITEDRWPAQLAIATAAAGIDAAVREHRRHGGMPPDVASSWR